MCTMMIYTHVLNRGPAVVRSLGGPDVPLMTQPALHRGATQDSKGAAAGRIAVLPRDSQAQLGVFDSMDAGRYTAPRAAFIVLRGSR
jgi:hypothetical protein